MSTKETGAQWDYPYGGAPIQWFAVEGARRYGYNADADRISHTFLSLVQATSRARWEYSRESTTS
jgi:alpha,alpha-trehalase